MRIFVIGAGAIARRHAEAALKLLPQEDLDLQVADVNDGVLDSFISAFPMAKAHRDARAMLGSPAKLDDVVIVATPPVTHLRLASMALKSGRSVLCEKPLAMNREEAFSLLSTAAEAGQHIASCDTRLIGVSATEAVRELLNSGGLGRPYHATFVNKAQRNRSGVEYQSETPWFLDRSVSGGGTLMDWGPYDFAVLDYLLDPVRVDVAAAWMCAPSTGVVTRAGAELDTEQHVGASLRYFQQDGNVVDVTYERSACTHGEPRTVAEIEGSDGAVSWEWIDWTGTGLVETTKDVDGLPAKTSIHLPLRGTETAHDRPLSRFLRYIRGGDLNIAVDERAIFPFLCLQAVYEVVRDGRAVAVRRDEL